MNDERTNPQIIRYIYRTKDGEPLYVNGVCGNITEGRGELILHFFLEYAEHVPYEEKIERTMAEGRLQDKISRIERYDPTETVLTREIKATLVIPLAELSTITNWMIKTSQGSQDTQQRTNTRKRTNRRTQDS